MSVPGYYLWYQQAHGDLRPAAAIRSDARSGDADNERDEWQPPPL
jgi:hypothetical protein